MVLLMVLMLFSSLLHTRPPISTKILGLMFLWCTCLTLLRKRLMIRCGALSLLAKVMA